MPNNRRKSIQVITLGCSKNTVDTQHILSQVEKDYEVVPEGDNRAVDYLLINTCGFIGDAKEESVQAILDGALRKKAGNAKKLFVLGCLSQRYMGQLPALVPEVDKWFGARDFAPVVKALGVEPGSSHERMRCLTEKHRSYAYLKISEGCDRRCSYCAIPFIRGAHKSVPVEMLVKEATELAGEGVKELLLIAQDTTYYGLDLYGKRSLAKLIQELSKIKGIEWIRIHYSYPADFPEDVLKEMADNPKVCKYLDIPLQHISDKVLNKMHRGVDGEWTRNLIAKLRSQVPGVVLRTTMIVGHPGEGKREFQELLDFVAEAKFERLGAFKYSEEEGTFDANNFRDRITKKEKQRRLSELMELQSGISLAFNQSRVGKVEKVLVDDYADGVFICRSQYESPEVDGEIIVTYSPDKFPGIEDPEELCGIFMNVKITGADEYDLTAEPIGG
ncbi:MAG: 30S ribosomal protein S12 methylthiotransferase RimO [Bacteroidales bacterium]|jgi:ribosomal protein S12 methylthiotransferase|nr:30S ribosomal protein S12 methylthiotransferase RimO [Bacteroidales bacterium]MCI2135499.1 30S ribosomal protein S12 methylthiotransferase RimO [Bacteroidales bacterium]